MVLQYQPLRSSRAIRLLQFLPGPRPVCNMVTVEVEKAPPYIALSYTWGDKSQSRAISINGCEARVTVNLAEAVDAIFDFARSRDLMFWADSICINQTDIHERSSQVRLMNTIYRSAEMVTVWLGPAANDSDTAFKRMEDWSSRLEVLRKEHGGSQLLAVASIPLDDVFFFGCRERRALKAMSMLCRRPWWTRAWVVQEGSVASKKRTILFCGSQHVDWACWQAALHITHHVLHFKSSGMSIDYEDGMPIRLEQFRCSREKGANIRLLDVLVLLRAYVCEDPRDKIYAALGMAMDVSENDLVPDYQKPYGAVCRDVVNFYISKSDSHVLDFLGAVVRSSPGTVFERSSDLYQLPSWIPDWTYRVSMWPLEKNIDSDSFDTTKSVYSASGTLPLVCHVEDRLLHLQGSIIDSISKVFRVCEWNLHAAGLSLERKWLEELGLLENPDKRYATGGTLSQAFNHTVVADVGRCNPEVNDEFKRGFHADWDLLRRDAALMTPSERDRQNSMLIDIKATTFGRRLFLTSRGYLGLGPASAEVNDEVCLFSGGQVLYVVRKSKGDRFEFVGECYVHDLMDGEACDDESFVLRDIVLE